MYSPADTLFVESAHGAGGIFSSLLAKYATRHMPHVAFKLHLFEPQPRFRWVLQETSRKHNASFYAAIAASDDGDNTTLFVSKNSMAASTLATNTQRYNVAESKRTEARPVSTTSTGRQLRVPSINLARLLLDERARLERAAASSRSTRRNASGSRSGAEPHTVPAFALFACQHSAR